MERMENILRSMDLEFFGSGKHKIRPEAHLANRDAVLLDVRSNEEHDTLAIGLLYHMPVIHIPTDEIPDRMADIPKDVDIGVFCSSGVRASIVYGYLRSMGYDRVRILEGGYNNLTDECKPGKLLRRIKSNKEQKA